MNPYFTSDWRTLPDHDSYGHDVEAACLLLEAAHVLGLPHDVKTERAARLLVDHALAYGWDDTVGGFFRHGTTFGSPEDREKEWWIQMEGLNALILMHETHGKTTDVYFKAYQCNGNSSKSTKSIRSSAASSIRLGQTAHLRSPARDTSGKRLTTTAAHS